MSVNVCPDDIFSVSDHVHSVFPESLSQFFADRAWYIVVYYHELVCRAEKLVHCVQCQGHSKGIYNKNITISVVSSKLLVSLLQTWFDTDSTAS